MSGRAPRTDCCSTMRVKHLVVQNFRALTYLELRDLEDTVVVAGPNGCGKSCVFDALRLLKSAYGGYQPNEWHQWFGEFQVNFNKQGTNWIVLFQDRTKPLVVEAAFELSESERAYLGQNARRLLTEETWQQVVPELVGWGSLGAAPLATNYRVHEPKVTELVNAALPQVEAELAKAVLIGRLELPPVGDAVPAPSPLLELVFSRYDPENVGIIDYHGANRNYAREQVGGINLNIQSSEDKLRQHALYNYSNKYANLKTEMAASYVRHLLARDASAAADQDTTLSDTLKELFETFFPGKTFLGPKPTPDGRLLFPVRTASGAEHDIDDLSSGEKEVLYGYLRLRNAAPRRSVLLIDEPELHLNPRLVSGLASFYHKHLGKEMGNQLWLVTHSDALIREAVGQPGFAVFHLQAPDRAPSGNQAAVVSATADIERLVIELVGDLAAYRPGAKVVLFEGHEDTSFDVQLTRTLFPDFDARVNCIALGSKTRVAELHEVLRRAKEAGALPGQFFAVTDRDGDEIASAGSPQRFQWAAYHIENHLLEPKYIREALAELEVDGQSPADEPAIANWLETAARETIGALVSHRLRTRVNAALVGSIDLSGDPTREDIGVVLSEAVTRSHRRLAEAVATSLTPANLRQDEMRLRRDAEHQLQNGDWRTHFRGRDVLRRFAGSHVRGVDYTKFRNLIVARMRADGFRPPGMKPVIDAILMAT